MRPVELVLIMRDKTRQALLAAGQNVDSLSGDYDELIRAIRASESAMQQSGQTAQRISGGYGSLLAKIGGAAALTKFGQEIINVRGEMEMMEKSFEVLAGSGEAATKMLTELKDVAVKSPLSLTAITDSAQMLMGYNIEAGKTVEIIKQMSDISMGQSDKFQSLILAFSQMSSAGQVLSQDLRQMSTAGFNPLVEIARTTGKSLQEVTKEMNNGAITVDMVSEAFRTATSEGGKFYGMTEKQAEGLVGLQASLTDAWTNMLNELGESGQGIISEGYRLATSLVENYETIGKVLVSLIATYGTYKVAVILATATEKGWTVAQVAHYNVLLLVERAQKLLNATMLANPYVLVATAVVGLATAIWTLRDNTTAHEKAQKKLNDTLEEAKQKKENFKNKTNELISIIKDETQTVYAQVKAYEELKKVKPNAFNGMSREQIKALSPEEIQKAINETTDNMDFNVVNKMFADAQKKVEDLQKAMREASGTDLRTTLGFQLKDAITEVETAKNKLDEMSRIKLEAEFDAKPAQEKIAYYNQEIEKLDTEKRQLNTLLLSNKDITNEWEQTNWETANNIARLQAINDKLNEMKGKVTSLQNIPATTNYGESYRSAKQEWDTAKKELTGIEKDKDKFTNEQYKNAKEREERAKKAFGDLGGITTVTKNPGESSASKAKKQAQEQSDLLTKIASSEARADLDSRQRALDTQQKLLDIKKDGFDKQQQQNELNFKKELLAIDKQTQDLIEKQQEAERLKWKESGEKGAFTPKTTSVDQLPKEQQDDIRLQQKIAFKTWTSGNQSMVEELTKQYQTYADRRLEVENRFNDDLAVLQANNQNGENDEKIAELEKQRKQRIKEINEEESAELVKTTDLFVRLFTDASEQSVDQVRRVIDEVQALYDYLSTTKTEDIADGFGFTAEQLRTFKTNAEQIKSILDGLKSKKKELGDRSPVDAFSRSMKEGLGLLKKGGNDNIKLGIENIGEAVKEFSPYVKEFGQNLDSIFGGGIGNMVDGATEALNSVMNVAEGFAKGGIIGGIAAVVGEAAKLFTKAAEAEKRHQEALKEIADARLASQRQYNLLLLEQNLLLKKAASIFGEKEISKAANALKVYYDAVELFKKEMQGENPKAPTGPLAFLHDKSYQKELDAYRQGIGALNQIKIKTGHEKTGMFGWGKGKDVYSSILDVYGKDKLLNPDGSLNIDFAKTILDTQTLSDENKNLLQSLIDLQEQAEKAQEALRDYLKETFGSLGNDLMDSIVASIQDKGVNAWESFGDAGAKVIENLGRQLAYELFFADRFAKLQKDLEAVYGEAGNPEEIARKQLDLVSQFYNTIGNDMDAAQAFMENWQREAEQRGFNLWKQQEDESKKSQSGKPGAFMTMTQDQGGELVGLFTSFKNRMASIDEQLTGISDTMYRALDVLNQIAENTSFCRRLEDMADNMERIIRDGIKVK